MVDSFHEITNHFPDVETTGNALIAAEQAPVGIEYMQDTGTTTAGLGELACVTSLTTPHDDAQTVFKPGDPEIGLEIVEGNIARDIKSLV